MVAARLDESRVATVESILQRMNHAPGRVNPDNALLPFARFARLHVARLAILRDNTLADRNSAPSDHGSLPIYLVFIGDCDGDGAMMLADIADAAEAGLREIFGHCEDPPDGDLLSWLRAHSSQPEAQYVNWVGRGVMQIREEQALHDAMRAWLAAHPAAAHLSPLEVRSRLIRAMHHGGHAPPPLQPMPLTWRLGNWLHLVCVALLLLTLTPFIVMGAPIYLIILRRRETTDPVYSEQASDEHIRQLNAIEDHSPSNQFTGFGSVKPGRFRLATLTAALWLLSVSLRHIYTRGRLARVGTIHFARWVFMDNRQRLFFATNYDASMDSYMDDFINKVAYGLNLVFSNGIGWPRTRWLLFGGAANEQQFKYYLRRHQLPAQVWYKAYPELSVSDLARNTALREGFERAHMTEPEARQWLSLI